MLKAISTLKSDVLNEVKSLMGYSLISFYLPKYSLSMKTQFYVSLSTALFAIVLFFNPQIAFSQPPPEDLKVDEAYIINKVSEDVYLELSHDQSNWGNYKIGKGGSENDRVFYQNLSNQNANRERFGFLRVYTPGTSSYTLYEVIARRRYQIVYKNGKARLQQMTL